MKTPAHVFSNRVPSERKKLVEQEERGTPPKWEVLEAACHTGDDVRNEFRALDLRLVLLMPNQADRDAHGRVLERAWS